MAILSHWSIELVYIIHVQASTRVLSAEEYEWRVNYKVDCTLFLAELCYLRNPFVFRQLYRMPEYPVHNLNRLECRCDAVPCNIL